MKRVGTGWKSLKSILCQLTFWRMYIVHAYQRIEEAVAGLKEGGTEVEGMMKKLEMGEAAVAASKNKVG